LGQGTVQIACHDGSVGSITEKFMWDLRRKQRRWNRGFCKHFYY